MLSPKVMEAMCDFHRCPNDGTIISSPKDDDKALCRCGKVNPQIPTEYPGVHIKNFLRRATAEEYIKQNKPYA